MANHSEVLTFIAQDMLRQVKNNLQAAKNLSGENLVGKFSETPRKGETISVRKAARFIGRTGETYTAEDYIERTVPIAVQTTDGLDITLTQRELMFQFEDLSKRVVAPAAQTLANIIDTKVLALMVNATSNVVGVPGTTPTSLKTYNQARALMSWLSCPQDGHIQLVSPDMQVEIADAMKGLFVDPASASVERGYITSGASAKWYEVQNLPTLTVGAQGGTPLVSGTIADAAATIPLPTTSTVTTSAWSNSITGVVKKGDILQFEGCYAVNPWTRASINKLRNFVVTADVNSSGTGTASIVVSPAIIASGPYQNVSNVPANTKHVYLYTAGTSTVTGSTTTVQGIRFHPEAFIFGTIPQPEPGGVEFAKTVTDPQTGLSIRFIRDWKTDSNYQLNRFDVVWAFGSAFPDTFACRIAS